MCNHSASSAFRISRSRSTLSLTHDAVTGNIASTWGEMQEVFGSFGGKLSFQRSPTRWVDAEYTEGAAA